MNESPNEHRRTLDVASGAAEVSPTTWPLLAQIPHICETAAPTEADGAKPPEPPAVDEPTSPALSLVSDEDASDPAAGRQPLGGGGGRAYYAESAHGGSIDAPWMLAEAAANSDSTAASRLKTREQESPAAATGSRQTGPSLGLSSPVYRLHETLAPHAGAIVAVALVLCAGLLYWLALGPPRHAMDYQDMFGDASGLRTVEGSGADPLSSSPEPAEDLGAVAAPSPTDSAGAPVLANRSVGTAQAAYADQSTVKSSPPAVGGWVVRSDVASDLPRFPSQSDLDRSAKSPVEDSPGESTAALAEAPQSDSGVDRGNAQTPSTQHAPRSTGAARLDLAVMGLAPPRALPATEMTAEQEAQTDAREYMTILPQAARMNR